MGARVFPEKPQFADDSEQLPWQALKDGLGDHDVLLHGVRFTDPEGGEVEIDLLVLMPDSGAAVIEVKGGHVTYRDGGFHQSDLTGSRDIDPIGQARRGVYALQRFLERQPTWSRGRLRALWLVCLPFTDVTGDLGPEGRRDAIIDKGDLVSCVTMVDIVGQRLWDPSNHTELPARGWIDAALTHLLGSPDTAGEIGFRTAARLTHVDQLTSEQASVLDGLSDHRHICVTGPAGTGKTWLAMEQARRWSAAGERVCLVSYGRGVAETMKKALADLPDSDQPAFIGTFHQLGWEWGVKATGSEGAQFWEKEAPVAMLEAAGGLSADQRFTAFVVDEAQDFADSWWPALLAFGSSDDVLLAVFRDDEQSVFSQRRGKPETPLISYKLSRNLRNADEIASAFRPLVSAEFTSRSGSGFAVEYVHSGADAVIETADEAVEVLLQRGWLPEHIALLTTKHRHPVQLEKADDKAGYWEALWDTDMVFYSTVAGFKGLERPAVVLAVDGFHDGIDPRSVMYAGMSRARDELIVVGPRSVVAQAIGDEAMSQLTGKG